MSEVDPAFVERVMRRALDSFEAPPELTPHETALVRMTIAQLHGRGFSEIDAVRYVRCIEHMDPSLDEDVALGRMKVLTDKYGGK